MRKIVNDTRVDPPPFVFAPTCANCERKMRLSTIEHFRGAETRLYRCQCGGSFSQVLNWDGATSGEELVIAQFQSA
jgi:hypothetical protein